MTENKVKFYKICNNAIRNAKNKCTDIEINNDVIVRLSVDYDSKLYSFDWLFSHKNIGGFNTIMLSGNLLEEVEKDIKINKNYIKNWDFDFEKFKEITAEIVDINGNILGKYTKKN